ncbi:MAG: HEAT repeat domain-containing protein, partial [candidate division NC10 bacterium]
MSRAAALLPALVLLALLLPPSLGAAQAGAEPTREEALAALAEPAYDAEVRRRAALWLARKGLMEDVPALVDALRDVDPLVRAFAETALWQVWSRSGDEEVDRLFAIGVEQMAARQGDVLAAGPGPQP